MYRAFKTTLRPAHNFTALNSKKNQLPWVSSGQLGKATHNITDGIVLSMNQQNVGHLYLENDQNIHLWHYTFNEAHQTVHRWIYGFKYGARTILRHICKVAEGWRKFVHNAEEAGYISCTYGTFLYILRHVFTSYCHCTSRHFEIQKYLIFE